MLAELAKHDAFVAEVGTAGAVDARPLDVKEGVDPGIAGRLYFHDSADASEMKEALISVKGGGVNVTHVRDLRGTVEREAAAIGVLLCMEEPTRPMLREAADAGFYTSPAGTQHPRLQILTVAQLLNGQKLGLPAWHDVRTFKKAPKAKGARRKDAELF